MLSQRSVVNVYDIGEIEQVENLPNNQSEIVHSLILRFLY